MKKIICLIGYHKFRDVTDKVELDPKDPNISVWYCTICKEFSLHQKYLPYRRYDILYKQEELPT